MNSNRTVLAALLGAGLIGTAVATAATTAPAPKAVDTGALAAAGNSTFTVTVPMKLRDTNQLNSLLQAIYTPGDPQFHHFLSKEEFARRFGPSDATVAMLTQHFQSKALAVVRAGTSELKVTGNVAALQNAFGVQLHGYEVPATASTHSYRYHAPLGQPQLATEISASVHGVLGLDSRPRFQSQAVRASKNPPAHGASLRPQASAQVGSGPVNPYGQLTVADFTQIYNVTPLYQSGFKGEHRTVGIVTLAAFTPSDAFKYWDSVGLTTDPGRIKEIQIDGGSGPASDASGSCETTLDVEQAGGIAPAARIAVYEAPNTDQGWLDAFAAAVDDNVADTISTSWSTWEFFESSGDSKDSTVTDPVNGRQTTMQSALNDVLIQAALQGQSAFAASGDHGAYASQFHFDIASNTLTVEFPASEPLITAAGGTTLPRALFEEFPDEAAWGMAYFFEFPFGSGGGVSSSFPRPLYQLGIPGMLNTEPGQVQISFILGTDGRSTPGVRIPLPTNFPGRNVPDVSLNSDPGTGYTVLYTSDVNGFEVFSDFGGTSFASPQLSAVTSLLDQALGRRLGLLNFPLYDLARHNRAYGGSAPPLRDITLGDNWHYTAQPGYDQATGLGVPNFANLLEALKH